MSYGELYIAEKTMHRRLEEQRVVARQGLPGLATAKRYAAVTLAWLGQRLVTWGSRLQEQHSPTGPQAQPANRPAS
jgi:cell division protein FtsB